jgi:hypothetical protein
MLLHENTKRTKAVITILQKFGIEFYFGELLTAGLLFKILCQQHAHLIKF